MDGKGTKKEERKMKRSCGKKKIVVAGAAILDAVAVNVGPEVFAAGSSPADRIRLSTGGDALNEATVLARLAAAEEPEREGENSPLSVSLLTVLGEDMAGKLILQHCAECGILVEEGTAREGLDTGVNLVLVQRDGERSFLTDPKGSLRRLSREDILGRLPQDADVFCLASMVVSPLLGPGEMEEVFRACKSRGMTVCADMTRPKNGETVETVKEALSRLDFLFANEAEAAALTGEKDAVRAARALHGAGVSCAVIKRGARGCCLIDGQNEMEIPACPVRSCVDTTGAGDSFAAGFLYALSRGKDTAECARFANRCGALAVQMAGASEWTKEIGKGIGKGVSGEVSRSGEAAFR